MGNGLRSKFFLCFRPVQISDDTDQSVDCFISVAKMEKPGLRRSFSGAFKAALSETSLSKKLKENKRRKRLRQNSGNFSDESVSSSTTTTSKDEIDSPTSVLSPCCSSLSEISKNLLAEPKTESKVKLRRRKQNSISLSHVLYLLLVSLWVTVLWGKFVAVVMTTIWIYVVRVYMEGNRFGGLMKRLSWLWEKRREKFKVRQGVGVCFSCFSFTACKLQSMMGK